MGRPLLGDRPTTGAERKRKWREREREKRKLELPFDPTDGMAALMARALPRLNCYGGTCRRAPSPAAADHSQ